VGLGGDGHDGTVGGETAPAWSTRLAKMSSAEVRDVQAGDDDGAAGGAAGTIHASPAESIRLAKMAPSSCEGGGGIMAASCDTAHCDDVNRAQRSCAAACAGGDGASSGGALSMSRANSSCVRDCVTVGSPPVMSGIGIMQKWCFVSTQAHARTSRMSGQRAECG
jgi:hypothetical protein